VAGYTEVEVAVVKGLAIVMVGATELLVLEYVVVVVVIERVEGQETALAVEVEAYIDDK
jgi:hypothetical protein